MNIINHFYKATVIIKNRQYFITYRNREDFDRQLLILRENYGDDETYFGKDLNVEVKSSTKHLSEYKKTYKFNIVTTHHLRKILPSEHYKTPLSRKDIPKFINEELEIKAGSNIKSLSVQQLIESPHHITLWSPDEINQGQSTKTHTQKEEFGHLHLLQQPGLTGWLLILTSSPQAPHKLLNIETMPTITIKNVSQNIATKLECTSAMINKEKFERISKIEVKENKIYSFDLETTSSSFKFAKTTDKQHNDEEDTTNFEDPEDKQNPIFHESENEPLSNNHKVYAAGIHGENGSTIFMAKSTEELNSPKIWEKLFNSIFQDKIGNHIFITINGSYFDNHLLLDILPRKCPHPTKKTQEYFKEFFESIREIESRRPSRFERILIHWTEEEIQNLINKSLELHLDGMVQQNKDFLSLNVTRKLPLLKKTTSRNPDEPHIEITTYSIDWVEQTKLIFKDITRIFPGSLRSLCQIFFPEEESTRKTELNYNQINKSFNKYHRLGNKLRNKAQQYLINDLVITRKVGLAINNLYLEIDNNIIEFLVKNKLKQKKNAQYITPCFRSIWGTYTTANIAQLLLYHHFIQNPDWELLTPSDPEIQSFIRMSIHGGVVQMFRKRLIGRKEAQLQNKDSPIHRGDIFDVNSLYPHAMLNDYPCGRPYIIRNPEIDVINSWLEQDTKFIVSIRLKPSNKIVTPPMGFYNTPTSMVKDFTLYDEFSVVLTCEQLKTFLTLGYKILEIDLAIFWTDKKPLFKNFVKFFYDLRKENQEKKNPIEKLCKLLMNSLYGKQVEKTPCSETIFEYCETNKRWKTKRLETGDTKLRTTHLGAMILGYSQNYITNIKHKLGALTQSNHPLLYSDTDSFIVTREGSEILKNQNLIGKELGLLKHEHKISEFYCSSPKLYCYKSIEPNNESREIVRSKGVHISFKGLKRLVLSSAKHKCRIKVVSIRDHRIFFTNSDRIIKTSIPLGLKLNKKTGCFTSHKSSLSFSYFNLEDSHPLLS